MRQVCRFDRFHINLLSLICSLFVVLFLSFIGAKAKLPSSATNINNTGKTKIIEAKANDKKQTNDNKKWSFEKVNLEDQDENTNESLEEYEWYLEIPKINLKAEIKEGVDEENLNNYIGHFEQTGIEDGNVGLAAHNRGYENNYFAKLKDIEIGDSVYYYYNKQKIEYIVSDIFIIYETDWSVLEDTSKDLITMITCVENRPEYRLCVIATRKET